MLDRNGVPKYKKRGDLQLPIYEPPDSIGFVEKIRGAQAWQAAIWIPCSAILNMQCLITMSPEIYIELHEVKIGKRRAVRSINLQTNDPDEE